MLLSGTWENNRNNPESRTAYSLWHEQFLGPWGPLEAEKLKSIQMELLLHTQCFTIISSLALLTWGLGVQVSTFQHRCGYLSVQLVNDGCVAQNTMQNIRHEENSYKNATTVFDKKKTKRVSTKSASQPVGHLGNSLCSCSHLSSHLCVGKLKFKYCIGIVNLTLKELKSKKSVEMLWEGFEIRPEMLRAMFIHRPTFIYNVLSPLSARQDGFHWRTWWKTPVSLFSHLFRIFHHPFQCLHACLPYLIFDDGLHKIGKSVWTKGVISLIVGLRYRILELSQPMKR